MSSAASDPTPASNAAADAAAPVVAADPAPAPAPASGKAPETLFDLSALDAKKKPIDLAQFKGQVVLIVNVASKCGFTPQYTGLEALYKAHKDQGFTILGFPCNSFGSQEPGTEDEIVSFCSNKYSVSFPIMAKVEVNGDKESPVYNFLKSKKSGMLGIKRIKWNFEK